MAQPVQDTDLIHFSNLNTLQAILAFLSTIEMLHQRRPIILYPAFQIPLMGLVICLIIALLFWLFGVGRPTVAVAISLDLSVSTYSNDIQRFNAPGTVMQQEIEAVRAYLDRNSLENLRIPNKVQVFGFGGVVLPLTQGFQSDSKAIKSELDRALQVPNLVQRVVPNKTDISLAIQEGTRALSQISDHCRELLLVTDGEANVLPQAVADAVEQRVKINSIVVGNEAPALRGAAIATGGTYISNSTSSLEALFTHKFFTLFNSNWRWLVFWLGLAWICLMWVLYLPLYQWVFQDFLKVHWTLASKIAFTNALFWTTATPGILWRLLGSFPFSSQC